MPALNETILYDHEGQLEASLKTYLKSKKIYCQVTGDVEAIPDEVVIIEVESGEALNERQAFKPDGVNVYYQLYSGTLTLSVITRRINEGNGETVGVSGRHRELRALCRRYLGPSDSGWVDNSEWVKPVRVVPSGTSIDVDDDNDVSELTFEIQFVIPPSSFPS